MVGQQSSQPPGLVGQQAPVRPSAAHFGCEPHVSPDGVGPGEGGVGEGGEGGEGGVGEGGAGPGAGPQQPASVQFGKQAKLACSTQHFAQAGNVFGSVAQGLQAAHAPVTQMSHLLEGGVGEGGDGGEGGGMGGAGDGTLRDPTQLWHCRRLAGSYFFLIVSKRG